MMELALDTELTREQREYLTTVKSSADSLLSLINDILDFSKIEAGRLDFERVEMSIRDTLGEIMQMLAHRASERGLELAYRIKPEVPAWVTGDPGRLRQIVVNLVGNGIKFTEKGEVVLEVEKEAESESAVTLHFTVRDTGIGIPPEKLKLIFEAFTQLDSSTTRRHGGTGLGLAITRRLVELYGGTIWAESEPGRGSTFHFEIPFGRADERLRRTWPHGPEALRDLKVLVVDDNKTMRTIFDELLKSWGMTPATVAGGKQALEALEHAHASNDSFELVLLDLQMPEMDGFSVAREIRARWPSDAPKILLLSSSAQRGEAARCRDMGIAAYLSKPVKQSELLNTILRVMSRDGDEAAEPGLVTRYSIRKGRGGMRILLAEDNAVNRLVATRLLERFGHEVFSALNGREAVAMAEHDAFNLVLMDVQMPEMDGLEATRAIRQREKVTGKHLPIIAMTAHAMKGDREKCLDSGMDDYLTKPVQSNALQALLKKYEPAAANRAGADLQKSNWDPAKALERVGGSQEVLGELIVLLEEECPKILDAIRAGIARQDAKAVEFAAHSLKGAASYFFASPVVDAARELEMTARDKKLVDAPSLLARIETEAQKLLEELEAYARKVPS
jgi:two-component system, sensor histidine kinase and response regulator